MISFILYLKSILCLLFSYILYYHMYTWNVDVNLAGNVAPTLCTNRGLVGQGTDLG